MVRLILKPGVKGSLSVILVVVLVLLTCCQSEKTVTRSFCFWKTSFDFSDKEDSLMREMKVNHLYLRLFDVDWNPYEKETQPIGSISRWWNGNISCKEITPSVFITNTVMEKSSEVQLDSLAERIKRRMNMIITDYALSYANHVVSNYYNKHKTNYEKYQQISDSISPLACQQFLNIVRHEILIDCDWSETSRDKYFYFLQQLKKKLPGEELSATLRLWQYKYRDKAGVPPVNRCLLMCYNVQSPKNYDVANSIGSTHEISRYITRPDYPVLLDVALPLFGWAVLYRGQICKGLIPQTWVHDNMKDTLLLKQFAPTRYKFITDRVVGNTYVRNGDELRLEQVSPEELTQIATYLKEHITLVPTSRITFFDWDTANIHQYGIKNISKYYRTFHK